MTGERKTEAPRALLVKCRRDEDFYVAWSEIVEAPAWYGTRAEAIEIGYAEERIARADEFGTSSINRFYAWNDRGMIAEQRGFLPRRYLRAYALLYAADEMQAAFDLLEPLGVPDFPEVRRG